MAMATSAPALRVFTFSPDWGLPTTGPFALKLLAWLNLAGIPYRQVIQNNPGKGPTGKSPWAEIDGRQVGDSQRIIDSLKGHAALDLDAALPEVLRAEARAWSRAFEEGFHQALEWELFAHPAGFAYVQGVVATMAPPILRTLVANRLRSQMTRQLHARGIERFLPDEVRAIGCADIDALAARLAARRFLLADSPCSADLAVFGQVAPMACWPMRTPVADHVKASPAIMDWVGRMKVLCFPAEAG